MKHTITILPGDGIGPEIIEQSVRVLRTIEKKFHHVFTLQNGYIGAAAIELFGIPFPVETAKYCESSDAILFGAIGHPHYDNNPKIACRPEQGLLEMRKRLGLYINLRPIFTFKNVISRSPLKAKVIQNVDLIVIRELIGGIYFGKRGRSEDGTKAFDTAVYSVSEIKRVLTYAFALAKQRKKKVTVVDKANVLETSRLWRETAQDMEKLYPEVTVEYMFVDTAAMQLMKRPTEFDVIVTENMFGDILTDEASVIPGSIGLLPSASIGGKTCVYEPIHGSFPSAAGKNIANPIGSILSVALMLELSFGLKRERDIIFKAVTQILANGYGTKDLAIDKNKILSTSRFGDKVVEHIVELSAF